MEPLGVDPASDQCLAERTWSDDFQEVVRGHEPSYGARVEMVTVFVREEENVDLEMIGTYGRRLVAVTPAWRCFRFEVAESVGQVGIDRSKNVAMADRDTGAAEGP